jgi:preprotein translocase subunit SecG
MNTLPPGRPTPSTQPAQPAQAPQPSTVSVAGIVAVVALTLCILIAALITVVVLLRSFDPRATLTFGSAGSNTTGGPSSTQAESTLVRGIPRFFLLLVTYIIGMAAMANAQPGRRAWLVWSARAFCCIFMILSAVLLLAASIRFSLQMNLQQLDIHSILELIEYLFPPFLFAIFGAILGAPARLAGKVKYFTILFIGIFLVHTALLVLTPNTSADLPFLGNLVFLGELALICLICLYTDRLLLASEKPQ